MASPAPRAETPALRKQNRILAFLLAILAWLVSAWTIIKTEVRSGLEHGRSRRLAAEEGGFIGMASLGIVFTIVGAIVGLLIVFKLMPKLTSAGGNATRAISTGDYGDDTVNEVAPVMGMVVGFALLFGVVALVIGFFVFKRGKSA